MISITARLHFRFSTLPSNSSQGLFIQKPALAVLNGLLLHHRLLVSHYTQHTPLSPVYGGVGFASEKLFHCTFLINHCLPPFFLSPFFQKNFQHAWLAPFDASCKRFKGGGGGGGEGKKNKESEKNGEWKQRPRPPLSPRKKNNSKPGALKSSKLRSDGVYLVVGCVVFEGLHISKVLGEFFFYTNGWRKIKSFLVLSVYPSVSVRLCFKALRAGWCVRACLTCLT